MTRLRLAPALVLCSSLGCYAHARRDAPAPPSSQAASEMVIVPPATFSMGDRNGEPDEYPERQISLTAYRIDVTEVSNASYRLCVLAKACDATPYLEDGALGKDDHPVVGATWDDARRFCAWVKKRLPTEAEWEYAAKGSGDDRKWPWKGAFDPKKANTNAPEDGFSATAPVMSFPEGASPFGVHNMAGNVAEWVADYFDPTYYRTSGNVSNPSGPTSGRERVVRGGSYLDVSHLTRAAARRAKLPTEADNGIGFRCAVSE